MLRDRFDELSQQADPPFAVAFAGYRRQVRTMSGFSFFAQAPEDRAARALTALAIEAERLRRYGFTEGELERARVSYLRRLESRAEEVDKTPSRRWSFQYVQNFLYDQPIPGPDNMLQLARQLAPGLTADEVTRAVVDLMTDENRVVLISGPEKEGLAWPDEAALAAILTDVAAADIAPYTDEVVDRPLVREVPAPAAITARSTDPELGTTTWTLANGVTVVLKPTDFKNDEVLMSAYGWGGTSVLADLDDYRRRRWAARAVSAGGVGAFDRIALEKALAGKLVSVSPQIDTHHEGFRGQASPQDLETLCQLTYLYATAPRRDADAFSAWRQRMETWIANRDSDPMNALRDTVQVRISSGDPRLAPLAMADLVAADLDTSLAFYRERFAGCGDFTFFFVGNVDPASFEPLARTWLGNLPANGRRDTWVDRYPEPPRGVIEDTVVKGLDPKSYVQMEFLGESPWSEEQAYALESLVAALRIRLRQVVREEKSGTYGVRLRGRLGKIPRPGYVLSLGWGCDPERTDELTEAVWSVIDEFRQDGPDPETLDKVRETQLREDQTALLENRFWLGQLAEHHRHGTDPRGILARPDQVRSLDAAMVRESARRYLDPDNVVKVVLYPEGRQD
jgi:zinc protease